MDLASLIELAQDFSDLGSAIQSQATRLLPEPADRETIDELIERGELNPNALDLISTRFLLPASERGVEEASEWLDVIGEWEREQVIA